VFYVSGMLMALLVAESQSQKCSYRMREMKWIEIIELRTSGNARKQLETHLQELIEQAEKKAEKQTVKLYTRVLMDTDVSIHLFHDSGKVQNRGSSLGIRLVSALKFYGLVNHTIWIEKQKDSIT